MYKILNDNIDTAAGKLTWNKTFNFSEIDWKKIYSWPFKITSNTSLQWIQTCMNHNILPTNKCLHKIKIIDNRYVHSGLKSLKLLDIIYENMNTHKSFAMILKLGALRIIFC